MSRRVPVEAGVYALVNHRAAVIYVGRSRNLARRRSFWRSAFLSLALDIRHEGVFLKFYQRCKALPAADWDFQVLQRFDASVDDATMGAAEYAFVRCIERLWPLSMLNTVTTAEAEFDRALERVGGVPYIRGTRYRIGEAVPASVSGLAGRLSARDRRVLYWLRKWCSFRRRPCHGPEPTFRWPR